MLTSENTLTSEEKKILSDLVISNVGDLNEVEEFDFTVKCSECTDDLIDILDKLCADPSAKTKIAERICLSLDELLSDDNEELTQISECLWVSVRYSVVNSEYTISGECM